MSCADVLDWLQSLDASFPAEEETRHDQLVPRARRPLARRLKLRSASVPMVRMDPGNQRRAGRGRGGAARTTGGDNDPAASGGRPSTTDSPTKRRGRPRIRTAAIPEDLQLDTLSEAASELDLRSATTLSHSTTFTQLTSVSRVEARSPSAQAKSRSKSPTKKIAHLQSARPPINVETVTEAPHDIKTLSERFASINDGFGILPRSLKTELNGLDSREYPNVYFDNGENVDTMHDLDKLQKLRSLRDAALSCLALSKPEPSWGEEVFRPLLGLAAELENRNNEQKVQVENVTTTQISPKKLVPLGLQDLPFESKRVDYCIYLAQSKSQKASTQDILASRNVDLNAYGINPAGSAPYVQWLPQLAAVECKNDTPGTDGTIQLGIWMAALRALLEGLLKPEGTKLPQLPEVYLKPMPCLRIDGMDWRMYWCCVGERGETMLYGPQNLGCTQDMRGMYRVLMALRELVKYGRDEYWPWFKEAILWESKESSS